MMKTFPCPRLFGPVVTALMLVALLATALAPEARAENRVPAIDQIVQAEIRPGWQDADGKRIAALHLRLAEGWRTYWRIPGPAGIAPQFDWSRSQNLANVTPRWPRPEVFDQDGYNSIGYATELVLPLEITPRNPSRPVALNGKLTIGLCREICIPADLTVSQPLRGNGAHDPAITAALERGPTPAGNAGLGDARCRVEPVERGAELTLRITLPRLGPDEHVIMELPGSGYWVSASRTWREADELVARATLRAPQGAPVSVSRDQLAYPILTPEHMIEHQGCRGG